MANYKINMLWTSSLWITQLVFGFQVSRIQHLEFPLGMPTIQVFLIYWYMLLPIFMMMKYSFCFIMIILQWKEKWHDSSRTISSRSNINCLHLENPLNPSKNVSSNYGISFGLLHIWICFYAVFFNFNFILTFKLWSLRLCYWFDHFHFPLRGNLKNLWSPCIPQFQKSI